MTLYYCPLEQYQERYTLQLSTWLMTEWEKAKIPFIEVQGCKRDRTDIKSGVVLDAVGRCQFAMNQIDKLLILADYGKITNDDIIYFDDFWHPGIESLPYVFEQLKIKPRMYAYLWAQSVDQYDFTYPMREWMRPFEQGIAKSLTGIFTSCHTLKNLILGGGIVREFSRNKVHVVGLPFSSEEVQSRMKPQKRENKVVWSSRWDTEKNPNFFISVATEFLNKGADVQFVICTGAKKLRSNNSALHCIARGWAETYPDKFIIKENLSKEQYYSELCSAKIQFNAASQDFVSFTLLEASVAGCYPVYPYFRSFPETFFNQTEFMYEHLDVESAVEKIESVLARDDLWTAEEIKKREWIHKRFDTTWKRMIDAMDGKPYDDPFNLKWIEQ